MLALQVPLRAELGRRARLPLQCTLSSSAGEPALTAAPASIPVTFAMLLEGSQVRDKKEFLEIRVPAVSAPVITRVSNVYPERTRQSGAVPAWQVPVNLCSPRGDTDQLLD